jgi:hypothetical protein
VIFTGDEASHLPARRRAGARQAAGAERAALHNAVRKLEAIGPALPALQRRPRDRGAAGAAAQSGPRAWRALYRRVSDVFVIAAVSPEAVQDPRGFSRACERLLARLAELEEE